MSGSGDHPGMPSDAALLVALAQGEVAALGLLYDRYAAAVYGRARALTATAAEAELVRLAVFLTLWRQLQMGTFGEQRLASWLYTAVWETAWAQHRRATAPVRSIPGRWPDEGGRDIRRRR